MRYRNEIACAMFLALVLNACIKKEETQEPTDTTTTVSPTSASGPPLTPEAVKKAQEDLQNLADRDRRMHACLSFEDFKATVYREPFEDGKFIVNGDTPIANEKQLLEFFEKSVKPRQTQKLILNQISGMDDKWNQQQKRTLTYCVSNTFGQRHAGVIQQMANATGEWEKVAAVDFIHDSTQDANCVPSNAAVVFDVRPVNVNEEYLARAFFPNEPRAARNVLIDESSFSLPPPPGKLQLVGILRHELGHTLGFRHEHTRPDSGSCFEDQDWKPLTRYDAFSVMHYPQCNGKGDWSLTLTDKDKNGVACLYGLTPPFTIDPTLVDMAVCTAPGVPSSPGQPQTQSFSAQSVAKNAQKKYGSFAVAAGTPLEVSIGGAGATGDPDLYVRFESEPGVGAYDCRPFLDGPVEVCSLTVPTNAGRVFVMVRGYARGTYDLRITRVPPDGTALAAGGGGTPQ